MAMNINRMASSVRLLAPVAYEYQYDS